MPSPDELAMAQRAAESLQDGTVTISAVSTAVNRTTMAATDTATRHYPPSNSAEETGPARLRTSSSTVSDISTKGQAVALQTSILSLPVATSGEVKKDDIVVWVTCPHNPGLVGRKFRIKGRQDGSHNSATRFIVEEAS